MNMNKKLMIGIPVIAGVLAISSGVGVAVAKGAAQEATPPTISAYAPVSANSTDSTAVVYCGGSGGMMGLGAGQGLVTQQVAALLGTNVADLQSELNSGKTLADMAVARGISQDQLILTMMAPIKDQMALMLKYGYLTQDQANNMTQQMQARMQAFITGKINAGTGYGRGFMGGMMQGYTGGMMGGWGNTTTPRSGYGGMMGRW